ncbi:transcription factor bHLH92 [Momordica charantia]|uniref:Transcription factor bHLH92 n=1 Tax=Momordica charantia TaxID=3673 RepID=A0A6J1CBV8_MOMCH|nr:transcription factor bHLH92 [Momordica charantia]
MDDGFPVEFWQSDAFWLDADLAPVARTSAFDPYSTRTNARFGQDNNLATAAAIVGDNSRNINKRMIEFWRKKWHEKNKAAAAGEDLEREKNYRHMLNERLRREKQRKSYLELHSMLPKKTKNDKNSIVQMAASTIQELKTLEAILERRDLELEIALAARKREKENGTTTTIRVALANPSSGINSMLAILNVLKTVGVNVKVINANFFDAEFSAQLDIDHTQMMGAAEVERVVQLTLTEAERKFQGQCQERTKFIKQSYFNFNN